MQAGHCPDPKNAPECGGAPPTDRAGEPISFVKNIITVLLILCLIAAVVRLSHPPASFFKAPPEIQVTRLAPGGIVVHEALDTRLAPYLALYHGAGWCPPCQRFSPRLAEFYHSADRKGLKFQLVMVNYDRSEGDMLAYMRQHRMEFPAVMRGSAGLWAKSTGNGIPNLMIVETSTGKVLSSSYDGDTYVGPDVPLEALKGLIR